MMKKRGLFFLIILVIVTVILLYFSPEEAYWIEPETQEAIQFGKKCAYNILLGKKNILLEVTMPDLKSELENLDIGSDFFAELSHFEIGEQLEKRGINFEGKTSWGNQEIHFTLLPDLEEMELLVFEKLEEFIVMSFAYTKFDEIVEIPGKGKLLFSVGIRYYNPIDERLIPKLIRKIANLPLIRNIPGIKIGTTGRWKLIDLKYTYNLNNYYKWALSEGKDYVLKKEKETKEFWEKYETNKGELEEEVEKDLAFHYDWASFRTEKQLYQIQKILKENENK